MSGKLIPFPTGKTALEFFSGIGLARAGMEAAGVQTIWANDIDETKCALYAAKWGEDDLHCGDVFSIDADDVPTADIAWASSPCTDLSLAGKREGLVAGPQSSAFFGFASVIEKMAGRRPKALILENVCGLATSHDGEDFKTVIRTFNELGYSVDAFELNARRWLPQSRPRLFVVALQSPLDGGSVDTSIRPDKIAWIHGDQSLQTHLTPTPSPPQLKCDGFTALTAADEEVQWWDEDQTERFIASLSAVQNARFKALVKGGKYAARTAYRRTRHGKPVWELRDDDIAGCLRTTRGGSSRQAVVCFKDGSARIRWMTGREYALLQGAGDFPLSGFSEPQIKYAFGDAVAVPAVTWLIENAVLPALNANAGSEQARAAV